MSQSLSNSKPVSPGNAADITLLTGMASGGIGAGFAALGDLFRNTEASAVMKIGEKLLQLFSLTSPAFVALIALIVLGSLLCWVMQPKTRMDAFARGFSILALLNLASPYENHALENPVPRAAPEEHKVRDIIQPRAPVSLPRVVLRAADKKGEPVARAIITLRDPATLTIIGKFRTDGSFLLPENKPYLIEIEAPGYRLSMIRFKPDAAQKVHIIDLVPSAIPLELQQLYGPRIMGMAPGPERRPALQQ